jgi:DNA-3-methyladenine glycosylase
VFLKGKLLNREFFTEPTLKVAKELLGCVLVVLNEPLCATDKGKVALNEEEIKACGIIVETEAYLGLSDKACHSYKANPKGRTNVMYGPGGYAYIYLVYGMYNCFNVVTEKEGVPEAVLIRALQSLKSGEERRFSGPGKLCREAGITREYYGADLCAQSPSRIIIVKPDDYRQPEIAAAKRIGVDYSEEAADYLYRFYDKNSPSVSK